VETRQETRRCVARPGYECESYEVCLLSEIDSGIKTSMPHIGTPPSTNFTGCGDYLEKLRDHFGERTEQSQHRRHFLLYGMGGAGKTQICLKFAEESSDW